MSWRGHLVVSHTHQLAVGSGVACGLVRGDFQAQVRSMYALISDQSLTTPLGFGISERTAIFHLRTSE